MDETKLLRTPTREIAQTILKVRVACPTGGKKRGKETKREVSHERNEAFYYSKRESLAPRERDSIRFISMGENARSRKFASLDFLFCRWETAVLISLPCVCVCVCACRCNKLRASLWDSLVTLCLLNDDSLRSGLINTF